MGLFTRMPIRQNAKNLSLASMTMSSEPGKERQSVGLNLDTGRCSRSKTLGGLLHDPLGGDQVDDSVGCLIEVLLGLVIVSQLLALRKPH
jgi:hypothetical protein